MGNTLKMDKIELLHQLFTQGWSNRKINRSTGLHRNTIAFYHKRWLKVTRQAAITPGSAKSMDPGDPDQDQSVPRKCPPGGVVHFEVPTPGTI